MTKTIGIVAIKGGVGKTTISSSLASDLVNHYGKKVLLVDANYSAPNVGLHMDIVTPVKTIHDVLSGKARLLSAIHTRYGVDVVPGSYLFSKSIQPLKLKDRIDSIKKNYDFIVIDSSPALNDETLSAMLASDHLFVVTTPDYPTLSCSLRAARLASQRGKSIDGIIINKIRNPDYEITINEIEDVLELPVVARIPDDPSVLKALFMRMPASIYNKKSTFGKEINKLSAALTNSEEPRSWWRQLFSGMNREEVNRQVLKQGFYRSVFSS
ncbi:AAA family ATPase [Candidatus Pacearchaeota archaeon]|nr:AAA family ATPase [Candidatus Pacearchaeota archaeon]